MSPIHSPRGVDEAGAEVGGSAEALRAQGEDAADIGGLESGVALEQERDDPADVGGRDRGAGGELIGLAGSGHQDIDAGSGECDVASAVRAGEELVVDVERRSHGDIITHHASDVKGRIFARNSWRDSDLYTAVP